jgi:hypothetical protein
MAQDILVDRQCNSYSGFSVQSQPARVSTAWQDPEAFAQFAFFARLAEVKETLQDRDVVLTQRSSKSLDLITVSSTTWSWAQVAEFGRSAARQFRRLRRLV